MYHTVFNLDDEAILWVDGNEDLVAKNKANGIPLCVHAILDETAHEATFRITNNGQSSSLLELGTHKESYPHIVVTETRTVQTETLAQMFGRIQKDPSDYNIWNFDIQGSELAVLRGSQELLKHCDMLVTEVNTAHVYKGCGLLSELDELLKAHGLHRVFTQMTGAQWGDALYVRKRLPSSAVSNKPPSMSRPTMTIAIPTMGRFEQFLHYTIPHYLEMDCVDQVLIADETGEDADAISAESWGSHPKLRVIRNQRRLGAYNNKLQLLRAVTTEWVALIDSDNYVVQEYFDALQTYWSIVNPSQTSVYIPAFVHSHHLGSDTYTPEIQNLSGLVITQTNWNESLHLPKIDYGLNLGNCVFHRRVAEEFEDDPASQKMVECKWMNKVLVERGYTLHFVPDMKYIHVVHPGSLYLTHIGDMQKAERETTWTL